MQKNNKIKICIFTPQVPAYSETFIENHINYLPFEKIIISGTDYFNLCFNGNQIFKNNYLERFVKFFLVKILKKAPEFIAKQRLKNILIAEKPVLLLFEYGHIAAEFFEVCSELGLPFIVHFHGNDASHKPTLELLKNQYLKMFQNTVSIIAVSKSMVNRLINLGASSDKIVYNPYGVDLKLFKPVEMKPKEKYFLAIGRFVEKKAPHLTILAYHRFIKEYTTDTKLYFIGDGPLLPFCKQIVKALKLENRIFFLGIKKPNETAKYLRNAFAFVQHSVIAEDGSAEGTPLAIIEASASGVPVISTNHEGICDVIENNFHGLLVEEFNYIGMANAMMQLSIDLESTKQMGVNSRLNVEKNYNLNKHIKILTDTIINSIPQ